MSIEDKIKAAAKNVEGKLESAAGAITGDNKMKIEGEAKQAQAATMNATADLKDKAQNAVDELKNTANNVLDNLKEKLN